MSPSAISLYTITAASKAITLLNRVAIAGYYTHAVGCPCWQFWRESSTITELSCAMDTLKIWLAAAIIAIPVSSMILLLEVREDIPDGLYL